MMAASLSSSTAHRSRWLAVATLALLIGSASACGSKGCTKAGKKAPPGGLAFTQLGPLIDAGGAVLDLAVSEATGQIAVAHHDGIAVIWDVGAAKPTAILRGHIAQLSAIAFSDDGARVATASKDGYVRAWAATGEALWAHLTHVDGVESVSWSADDRVFAGGAYGYVELDGDTGALIRRQGWGLWRTGAEPDPVTRVDASSDGRHVLTGHADGSAVLWDRPTGTPLAAIWAQCDAEAVHTAAFSPGGTRFVVGCDDQLTIFHTGRIEALRKLKYDGYGDLSRAQWSHDGRRLAVADERGNIWLIDPRLGTPVALGEGPSDELPPALGVLSGKAAVVGDDSGAVRAVALRSDGLEERWRYSITTETRPTIDVQHFMKTPSRARRGQLATSWVLPGWAGHPVAPPGMIATTGASPTPVATLSAAGLDVWRDGRRLPPVHTAVLAGPSSVTLGPAGDRLAVCMAGERAVDIFELPDLRRARRLTSPQNVAPDCPIVFSADAGKVLVGLFGGVASLDVTGDQPVVWDAADESPVRGLQVSSDGQQLEVLTTQGRGTLKLPLDTEQTLTPQPADERRAVLPARAPEWGLPPQLARGPDRTVITYGDGKPPTWWALAEPPGAPVTAPIDSPGDIVAYGVSAHGNRVAWATTSGLTTTDKDGLAATFMNTASEPSAGVQLALTADGGTVLERRDATLGFYAVDGATLDREVTVDANVFSVANDNETVVVGFSANVGRYGMDGTQLGLEWVESTVVAVSAGPNGLAAYATADGKLGLWTDGEALVELRTDAGPVFTTLAFTTDGAHLIAGDRAGTLMVFGTDDETLRALVPAHVGGVADVVVIDETRAVSTGRDGRAVVWDLETLIQQHEGR